MKHVYIENAVFWDVTGIGSYKCHKGVTSQKTAFFIVTAVKPSNLSCMHFYVLKGMAN
jgi:hypothetical protein